MYEDSLFTSVGRPVDAAIAASTFMVLEPSDATMQSNLKLYRTSLRVSPDLISPRQVRSNFSQMFCFRIICLPWQQLSIHMYKRQTGEFCILLEYYRPSAFKPLVVLYCIQCLCDT